MMDIISQISPSSVAIHLKPTGFSEPQYFESEVIICGFAQGEVEDTSRSYGKISGMMAICLQNGRLIPVPLSQIQIIEKKPSRIKCAICKGDHDNDLLTDICKACETRINEEGSP